MPVLTIGPVQAKGHARNVQRRRASARSAMFKKAADDFRELLDEIAEWATDNADRVSKLFLIVDVEVINLFVVAKSEEYDFALRKLLSDLVLSLREGGNPVRGSIIPDGTPEELRGVFDHDQAMSLSIASLDS